MPNCLISSRGFWVSRKLDTSDVLGIVIKIRYLDIFLDYEADQQEVYLILGKGSRFRVTSPPAY